MLPDCENPLFHFPSFGFRMTLSLFLQRCEM
jgi:hypothetical protein